MEERKMCAECAHWDIDPCGTWGTGKGNHKTIVECKGWCYAKPHKRRRWNYNPACKLFNQREMNGFIYMGGNLPLEEDLANIANKMKELLKDKQ